MMQKNIKINLEMKFSMCEKSEIIWQKRTTFVTVTCLIVKQLTTHQQFQNGNPLAVCRYM